jgi:hypothetical protein
MTLREIFNFANLRYPVKVNCLLVRVDIPVATNDSGLNYITMQFVDPVKGI